jgi:hypothetical protein
VFRALGAVIEVAGQVKDLTGDGDLASGLGRLAFRGGEREDCGKNRGGSEKGKESGS